MGIVSVALVVAAVLWLQPGWGRSASGLAPGQSQDLVGDVVVGRMFIDGMSGSIEVRGVEFAALGGSASASGGRGSPGTLGPLRVAKDVDVTTPQLLDLAIRAETIPMVTIEIVGPDGEVATTFTLSDVSVGEVSITHDGAITDRLIETLTWDLSMAKVSVTSGGASFCWDVASQRSC